MTRKDVISNLNIISVAFVKPVTKEQRKLIDDTFNMAIEALKTGHWIDHQDGRWIYAKCSMCGTVHDIQSNFCPNCGAKMKE